MEFVFATMMMPMSCMSEMCGSVCVVMNGSVKPQM